MQPCRMLIVFTLNVSKLYRKITLFIRTQRQKRFLVEAISKLA